MNICNFSFFVWDGIINFYRVNENILIFKYWLCKHIYSILTLFSANFIIEKNETAYDVTLDIKWVHTHDKFLKLFKIILRLFLFLIKYVRNKKNL